MRVYRLRCRTKMERERLEKKSCVPCVSLGHLSLCKTRSGLYIKQGYRRRDHFSMAQSSLFANRFTALKANSYILTFVLSEVIIWHCSSKER